MMESILIVGAGAAGQFLGRLWRVAGREVTFAARFGDADRLEKEGVPVLRTAPHPNTFEGQRRWPVVVLAVRGDDIEALLPWVKELAAPTAPILVLARDPLSVTEVSRVFRSRTVSTVLQGAVQKGPNGRMKTLVAPWRLEIGCEAVSDLAVQRRLTEVAEMLQAPELQCLPCPDFRRRRGTVYVQSLLSEAIATLMRVPPAVALGTPRSLPLIRQMIDEIAQGAWCAKVRVEPDWAEAWQSNVAAGGWCAHPHALAQLLQYKPLETARLARSISAGPPARGPLAFALLAAELYRVARLRGLGRVEAAAPPELDDHVRRSKVT